MTNKNYLTDKDFWYIVGMIIIVFFTLAAAIISNRERLDNRIDALNQSLQDVPHKICHNETIIYIPDKNFSTENYTWGLSDSMDNGMKTLISLCEYKPNCFTKQKEVCEIK